ncbi:cytidine deaminase, partial [Staphylococcus aureus]|nr:cytidine deaminase [Staphylococcus aureus]
MSYQPHYFQEVRKAQQESYSPYSQFKVGAYLKTKDGRTFYGTNVEN